MSISGVSVLCDIACHLGEGPTYDPLAGKLFWFDIRGRQLLEKSMPTGTVIVHDLPEMTSALAVIDDDRQMLVTETGLHIREVRTGAISAHTLVESENQMTRSNDSRVHPCGALWFSTMGKNEEKAAGSIYWFHKGEVRCIFPGITIPNSICFSPDGATAYFTDTGINILLRVDCDPLSGLPVSEPVVFFDQRGGQGGLDGSVVDAEGVLWNARWGAASLDAYSPDGKRILSIDMPATQTSCPAFVGSDASRIAVTSAWQGMDRNARQRDPEAGKTFLIDRPVKGRFDPRLVI